MCPRMSHRKNSEIRKIRKPLMEKKRRARINDSLEELKRLVLDAKKEEKLEGKPSKLEKADILELTIEHLKRVGKSDEDGSIYRRGYQECADRVKRLIHSYENLQPTAKTRLLSYLFAEAGTPSDPIVPNLTILPTKLANGDLAFVIPTSLTRRCLKLRSPSDNNRLKQENKNQEMWRPW